MDRRAVLPALLAAALVAVPVAAAPPAVSVSVGGAPLDPGEAYHTTIDPWVNVTATADADIELVEVRVDGVTRHSFEPSTDRFGRTVNLALDPGRHRLTVLVRADEVRTYEATLVRDVDAPAVNYTAPFAGESDDPADPPSSELTVSRGNASVSGSLSDLSTVAFLRIEHRYTYREGSNDSRVGREEHLLFRPGAAFSQALYLAPGANEMTLRVEDVLGNARTHEFTITVDDASPPAVNVTDIEWRSPTRLRIEGTATDRVQVDAVWAKGPDATAVGNGTNVGNDTRHHLVFPRPTAPDRDRRRVSFNASVYHPPGADHVVVGANDTAGNERTRNLSLSTYLAPTVRFDANATGYTDDRTLVVEGRIFDGQVGNASVETVDPETGAVVDARPLELGQNGTFRVRLAAAPDTTRVRVRVRDVSGSEHLATTNVTGPVDPTPTATPTPTPTAPATATATATSVPDGGDSTAAPNGTAPDAAGVRVPFVGVTLPLAASVSVPVPVVGPFEVPAAAAGLVVLLLVGLGVAAGRYG